MENVEKVKEALTALKEEYGRRYGYALFDVVASSTPEGVELSGEVLIDNQKEEALKAAREATGDEPIDKITVAGVLNYKPLLGWVVPEQDLANVWRFLPGSEPAKALGDGSNLSTQLERWDYPGKILRRHESATLACLVDGTIGWITDEESQLLPFTGENFWSSAVRAAEGDSVGIASSFEDLADAAMHFLGTPYLWGGASEQGIDCSGLVQRAFYDGAGIVLPKHSGNQLKLGERIEKAKVRQGDLVFFTVEKSILHVGIVLDEGSLIHANRDERKVVVEKLADALKSRRFAGARRVVLFDSEIPAPPSTGEEFNLFDTDEF